MSPDQLNARFEALRPHLPTAANDALLAVKYAADGDLAGSVAKARRVTEAVLKELLPPDVPDAESLALEQLKSMKLRVKLPRGVQACVAMVQLLGNEGAHHRKTPLTPDDARRTLDALAGLVEWYLHDHRKVPRPRRSRWGLVATVASSAFALLGAAVVAGGAATAYFVTQAPESPPVTLAAAEPAPSPAPAAVVAPTLPPATVAPVAVAAPLWSRPPFYWERPPEEDTGPAAREARCPVPVVEWTVRAVPGRWALVRAKCGETTAEGWLDGDAVTAAGGTVGAAVSSYTNQTWSLRRDAADKLLVEERWKEAAAKYDELLAEAPEEPDLYRDRGLARLRGGEPKAAVEDFAAWFALRPVKAKGRGHLYVAEALYALDDPGWDQVLSDAVASDPTLQPDVEALRAGPAMRVIRVAGHGPKGVPLVSEALRAPAVQRIRDGEPGSDTREICRLKGGESVDVLERRAAVRVRVRCSAGLRLGWLPEKLDGRPVLSE